MPFTFCHPAIVIPCKERYPNFFNFTALIIGSMAPDFEYFLRFKPKGVIGHTFLGILLFDLPLVFIFSFLWHYFIKESFILNMPSPVDRYFYHSVKNKFNIKSKKQLIIFIYSSIIGVLSHILWDGFTHKTGIFVSRISLLSIKIKLFNFKIPVYKFLQHGSTLLGFFIICIYIYSKKKEDFSKDMYLSNKNKIIYWSYIGILSIIILLYRVYILNFISIKNYGVYIVSFISSIIISITVISVYFKLYKLKHMLKEL